MLYAAFILSLLTACQAPVRDLEAEVSSLALMELETGAHHACARGAQGLYCWGENTSGQLGDGSFTDQLAPKKVPGSELWGSFALGRAHSCALDREGKAWCWGLNSASQLGDGGTATQPSPQAVSQGAVRFESISSGLDTVCAVSTTRRLYCWGENGSGETANGTASGTLALPTMTAVTSQFLQVSMGASHGCGITPQGLLKCWGLNSNFQLGDGTVTTRPSPIVAETSLKYQLVTAGGAHSCAKLASGEIQCWGLNSSGQIGDSTTEIKATAAAVATNQNFTSVTTGTDHTCALNAAGRAFCWGSNQYGQIGDGTLVSHDEPVAIDTGVAYESLRAGAQFTCGITSHKQLRCWGRNHKGQLGLGTTTDQTLPQTVILP